MYRWGHITQASHIRGQDGANIRPVFTDAPCVRILGMEGAGARQHSPELTILSAMLGEIRTDTRQAGPDQADAGSAYLWMMADKQMEEDSEQ